MESTKSFEGKLARIFSATNAKGDTGLANILGIKPPSVAAAKKRQQIPSGWVEFIAESYNISSDWLFFGRGPMRPGEAIPTAQDSTSAPGTAPDVPVAAQESACARCTKLEARLDEVERERRELTAENRHLWKENGVLREKCARLEERQYQRSIERGETESVGNAG